MGRYADAIESKLAQAGYADISGLSPEVLNGALELQREGKAVVINPDHPYEPCTVVWRVKR